MRERTSVMGVTGAAALLVLSLLVLAGCDSGGSPDGDLDVDFDRLEPCQSDINCPRPMVCQPNIQNGRCAMRCDLGDGYFLGDDFCAQFGDNLVCMADMDGRCAPLCAEDADCQDYQEGAQCRRDGRCVPKAECQTNSDCNPFHQCMPGVNGGTCMLNCTQSKDGVTGDELCREIGVDFVCHPDIGGYCDYPCEASADCQGYHPLASCEDHRCVLTTHHDCTINGDCGTGQACHKSDDGQAACLYDCTTGGFGLTDDLYCALIFPDTICHPEVGGACRPACLEDADCMAIDELLSCTAEGRCVAQSAYRTCESSTQCPGGQVCSLEVHVKDTQKGTCLPPCRLGGSVPGSGDTLVGDQYCAAFAAGLVCNNPAGGFCQSPCQVYDDCAIYGSSVACLGNGLCQDPLTITACDTDDQCPIGFLCHDLLGSGMCLKDCREGEWMTDNGYCNDHVQGSICHEALGGRCAYRCSDNAFCQAIDPGFVCRGDGECVLASNPVTCTADEDCASGICHKAVPGGACLPACNEGLGGLTGDGFCDLYTTEQAVCMTDFGGQCAPKCQDDTLCKTLDTSLVCDQVAGRCIVPFDPSVCDTTDTCPFGQVCHFTGGQGACAAPCQRDTDCPTITSASPRYCGYEGVCRLVRDRNQPCLYDRDCDSGKLCHVTDPTTLTGEGSCQVPCQAHDDCGNLGSGLWCQADGHCVSALVQGVNLACQQDGDCVWGMVCSQFLDQKICRPLCTADSLCEALVPGYFCDQSGHCLSPDQRQSPCFTDQDCSLGSYCHQKSGGNQCVTLCASHAQCSAVEAGTFCNIEGRCVAFNGCRTDEDCLRGQVCSPWMGTRGSCHDPCNDDAACAALDASFVCSATRACVPQSLRHEPCDSDYQCLPDLVCHGATRQCLAPCASDAACAALSPTAICAVGGHCVEPSTADCQADDQCGLGKVCHKEVDTGRCGLACAADDDCSQYMAEVGGQVVCDGDHRCVPASQASDRCFDDTGCATGKRCRSDFRCVVATALAETACEDDLDCPVGNLCEPFSGKCQEPCTADTDCLGDNRCYNSGRCAAGGMSLSCASDAHCPRFSQATRCHSEVGFNGLCAPLCASDDQCPAQPEAPLACSAGGQCRFANEFSTGCATADDCRLGLSCSPAGSCAVLCVADTDCASAGYACNAAGACVPGEQVMDACEDDSNTCPVGTVCHDFFGRCAPACQGDQQCYTTFGAGYACLHEGVCGVHPAVPADCTADAQCPFGQVCQTGMDRCVPPCASDDECLSDLAPYCNSAGRCVAQQPGLDCQADDQCPAGQVCMKETTEGMAVCLAPCESSEACVAVWWSLVCHADHKCYPTGTPDQCEQDSQCQAGLVCHTQIVGDISGFCGEPCDNEGDCNRWDTELYCTSLGLCRWQR